METITIVDIFGYLASAGVLISFLFKDMFKLRVINTLGCLLFIVYGVLLHYSIPVILTNSAIVCINLYFLIKERK